MTSPLHVYNLAVGALSITGLVYLAYSQRYLVGYRRFLYHLLVGFALFTIGGPLVHIYLPSLVHAVHGVAALFVVFGLYDPVHNDLRADEWLGLLLREPSQLRRPGEWMAPMDDEILELFHTSELVLTPAIIAYNIDRSREEVNRRLSKLREHGLVRRVERGKYRITEPGAQYLHGRLHVDRREPAAEGGPH